MAGGTVNGQVMSIYGMQTTSLLKTLRVDAAILGTSSFAATRAVCQSF